MRNTMSSSYHSKVISTENKGVTFLFCLVHGLLVIFSHVFSFYFPKVSTVNSDLINFVDVQRLHENIKWIVFLTRLSYNLFTKTLLLFRISLLKRFTYRRVSTPKILRGAMNPIMLTKKHVKTISDHFINKKLPCSQVIYCLLTRKIYSQEKSCWLRIFHMLVEKMFLPVAYVTEWTCETSGFFFIIIFLVSSPTSTTIFRLQNS